MSEIRIEWQEPVHLKKSPPGGNQLFSCDLEQLQRVPAVYIFGRLYAEKIEALYIGRTSRLKGRIRGHLKSVPLMLHLQRAKKGKKIVLGGHFIARPGQSADSCLKIAEKALIRHFMLLGHNLVNIHGTSLRQHEITSTAAPKEIPASMYVDH